MRQSSGVSPSQVRPGVIRRHRLLLGLAAKMALVVLAAWLLFSPGASGAEWQSESLPSSDQLFQRTNGWIGADGDFTVALTHGLTLWLFSDTFIGQVREGHRVDTTMVNNSAAWQRGAGPGDTTVEFFHASTSEGKPASLITPADGKGWFWLCAGIMAEGKLFIFLSQCEHTADKSAFGFRQIGGWLGRVANPLAPPTEWRVAQTKIPFVKFGAGEERSFGSAVLATNGYIYIFGTRQQTGAGRKMILARAPAAQLDDFTAWQFRHGEGWSSDADAASGLCDGMATEYSVSWLPALGRYVLICTEDGLSDKIIARTSIAPWGPWSDSRVVYRCPEAGWDKGIFCYAAKAHPMLTPAGDELVVTYAANTFEISQVLADARLYWPRFVRVKTSL